MPHKICEHKLLLDENFPQRPKLVRLNSRFDLKHIVKDYKKQGAKDEEIFNIAIKLKRLLVTFNDKHFSKISSENKNTGVIGVSTNLTTEQIDKKLTALLLASGPKELYGKFTYIAGEKTAN